MTTSYQKHDYHEYPKTLPRTAFWAQVRRTVAGRPVPNSQIALIREQIAGRLELSEDDVLLDLACGNGALSSGLPFKRLVGVDHSPYLIEIALEHFHDPSRTSFILDEAGHYCSTARDAAMFTKAMCYGSFSFFSRKEAVGVIGCLHDRFRDVERAFIGNIPDRSKALLCYSSRGTEPDDLDNHETQFGIWWDRDELVEVAESLGWHAQVFVMPPSFYAAAYRFDLLLLR